MFSIKPLHLIFMFQRTRAKTIRVKTMDIVSKLADQRKKLFAVTVSVPVTSEVAVTRVSKNTRIERFYCALQLLRHPFGLKRLSPLFHPIRRKTKSNRDSLVRVFPHLATAACNYLGF